jgi:hypothetical protein
MSPSHIPIFLVFIGMAARAETKLPEDFEKYIDAPGIGKLHYFYHDFGEPLTAPAKLFIRLKCDGMKEEDEAATLGMCMIKSHSYEKESRSLKVEFLESRLMEGSKIYCDVAREKFFDLKELCKQLWLKKAEKKKPAAPQK